MRNAVGIRVGRRQLSVSTACVQGVWEDQAHESTEYVRVLSILYIMDFSISMFDLNEAKIIEAPLFLQ